ncbi:MAG: hypothetical protein IJ629_06965 [Clostridia bacterium]|nr:hypothetical protein [Clostridia bacterium]
MKKLKQVVILVALMTTIILLTNQYVLAAKDEVKVTDFIRKAEYSNNFKKWTELSESEKENSIQPRMYEELDTEFIVSNPLYQVNLLGASLNSRYSLKDVIGSNVVVRNQRDTNTCWAFAGLSSLETNLALANYQAGKNLNKVYDFSERHVNYATTRLFANNGVNSFGFNRVPASGGQWLLVENYLATGQGAINEADMPFENNNNLVNLSEIQNKDVQTRLYDTIYFDNYNELTGNARTEEMNKIKQHIQNYGAVFASIHGDSSDVNSYNCYNNDTGAKYCNTTTNHQTDHAVSIVGWDDEYAIDNFAEGIRPSSKGAWIVKNSWGENLEYDVNDFKQEIFEEFEEQCRARGWNSPSEIPNSFIEDAGFTISGDKLLVPVGDHGFMYVSYEDVNVGETLYGITKATDEVDYDYIYQYNELYPAIEITLSANSTIICNVFNKQSEGKEYLTGVSLTAPETYTCKVYVNPNGTSKARADLKQVNLQTGSSETIDKGYHTLEFANPVEITSNQFVVAVEVLGTRSEIDIQMEGKAEEISLFDYVKTETGKCFVSSSTNLDTCTWFDLGTLQDANPALTNGDSCLKAFTTKGPDEVVLDRIEVATPPTRVVYNEGEDFEKGGLLVRAVYSDESTTILNDTDYSISNGTNLKYGQTSVLITYMDKTVEQPITVVKKQVEDPGEDPGENPGEKPGENPGEDPGSEDPKEDPTQEEVKAKNTDFAKAKCTLSNIRAYYYTSDATKNYTLVDTEISGINRPNGNDSYEYYYYLSPKSNLTNITGWVKVVDRQNASSKLSFTVDSRDLPNYSEVSKATTLYIYIKEVVTKGGDQSVVLSKGLKYEQGSATIETYIDGAKKTDTAGANTQQPSGGTDNNGGTSGGTNNNGGGSSNNGQTQTQGQTKDPTSSPTKLPYTGNSLILIGILLISLVGIGLFVRYEVLNRYVK